MSEQNVELVRAIYDRWAAGASNADLIAPDLEYVNPPYAVESGTVRDRSALGRVREVTRTSAWSPSASSTWVTTWW